VQNYLTNCRTIHADREFKYQGINEGILTEVSDFRVEQLLDKLIDNAIDFSDPGSTITVGINADARNLTLFVTNQGPVIADDMVDNVFDSMVSIRESNTDNRLHFGMGLYVVRIIAEHHRGSVKATNLFDGKGVSIKVMLPIYLDSKQHKGPSAAN
jgi:two-component system, OmpR family, sensor histidine kinase ChvG